MNTKYPEIYKNLVSFYNSYKGIDATLKIFEESKGDILHESKKLREYISPGNILFGGCGVGHHVWAFQSFKIDAHGFDISDIAIEKAVCKNCIQCNIIKTPYPDRMFDNVFMLDVIEHIPFEWLDTALSECKRLCQKNFVARIPHTIDSLVTRRSMEDMKNTGIIYEHTIEETPEWWMSKFANFFNKEDGWAGSLIVWSDSILDDGTRSIGYIYRFEKHGGVE